MTIKIIDDKDFRACPFCDLGKEKKALEDKCAKMQECWEAMKVEQAKKKPAPKKRPKALAEDTECCSLECPYFHTEPNFVNGDLYADCQHPHDPRTLTWDGYNTWHQCRRYKRTKSCRSRHANP